MAETKTVAKLSRAGNCCPGTMMPELAEIERIAVDPKIIDGITIVVDKFSEIIKKHDLVAGNCCPGTCMPEINQ